MLSMLLLMVLLMFFVIHTHTVLKEHTFNLIFFNSFIILD